MDILAPRQALKNARIMEFMQPDAMDVADITPCVPQSLAHHCYIQEVFEL